MNYLRKLCYNIENVAQNNYTTIIGSIMSNPKVSIVIPIYNVEHYLAECLDSVVKQTLREIEIICVNDGSTDKSAEIVKRYMAKDKRIRLISKSNSGYGHTMNTGFDAATGDYIGIVESDDYVEPNMFEILYNEAQINDVEVVKSNYYEFTTKNRNNVKKLSCWDENYIGRVICPKEHKIVFNFPMMNWTGIYKNSFIKNNNIRHNESAGASFQDNGFWFQVFCNAKQLMFINEAFYHYRQDNPNSSINSKTKVYNMCDEYRFIYNYLTKSPEHKSACMTEFIFKAFFNYKLTYERIKEEYKIDFLKRAADDFKLYLSDKDVDLSKIDGWILSMMFRTIDDPVNFYYDDNLYEYSHKNDMLREKIHKIRNSKEIQIGEKIKRFIYGKLFSK